MPIYETREDRLRQLAVADVYARSRGFSFRMADQLLPWDVEFTVDDKLVSLAEIKCRSCARYTYATYKIDKSKVDDMMFEASRVGACCGLLVQFSDGLFKLPMSAAWLATHARTSVIERKNRAGETPDDAWEWSNVLWQRI